LTQDRFVKGFEVIPGDATIVHHVLAYSDNTGKMAQLDAQDPLPGFSGGGTSSATLVGAWVPGSIPEFLPSGMGYKLKANCDIVLQIHYPSGSAGKKDKTKIKFYFANGTNLREVSNVPVLNHITNITNGPLFIPANTTKTFFEEYSLPAIAKISVLGVAPHMHLIGRSIKCYAENNINGTILPLINIPEWDFHWQGSYYFKHPQVVTGNYTLKAEAYYDNTDNNPDNPSSPPIDVKLGEQTTDEMMLVYFQYLTYAKDDELIDMDTVLSTKVNQLPEHIQNNTFLIKSNPVGTSFTIQVPQGVVVDGLTLYTITGLIQKQWRNTETDQNEQYNVDDCPPGIYLLQLRSGNTLLTQKFIKAETN
jgi:hypothetical protein